MGEQIYREGRPAAADPLDAGQIALVGRAVEAIRAAF